MNAQQRGRESDASAPGEAPACSTKLSPASTAAAYLVPVTAAAVVACLVMVSGAGPCGTTPARLGLGGGILLAGLGMGALLGRAASNAQHRAIEGGFERRLDDLDHDLRAPMTIIRGEVELVLGEEGIPPAERGRSSAAIIQQLETLESLLRRRYRT